ncbi:hypothetical protein AT15_00170 [Kosmotoga arenicorallina S304]|uniref:ATPase BadF/BadG/BcrA/BcrD type domain-containing protein n=1 Tax=Kosmotoga arenicorallina S304 TaxID=1453497 RepID=A0A182C871_9BACT|nr:BadF/BadG/BcrA/BcrD ATPase family protein [Kosmotoga arenicorallina]OAA32528.1 hypothetical protein AT15_00170 [Kosmotoga arenicorallina S304]
MKVMGIDGGGSNLSASVYDGSGFEKTQLSFSSNLSIVERKSLLEALNLMKSRLGTPEAIVASFSGAGDPIRERILSETLNEVFPAAYKEIIPDIEGIYRSCFLENPGVVVIAGTGSVVYGKNSKGASFRAGGWGHLFSDEGSAFWISKELIANALKYRDGLVSRDPIFERLLKYFNLKDLESLANLQISRNFKAKIASFTEPALANPTPLVLRVLDEAIELLSKMINLILIKTNSKKIVLSGGCFKSALYTKKITEKFSNYEIEIFDNRIDPYIAKELFQRLSTEKANR